MGYIVKQPNGKYCRFSPVVDTITHHNMTEEDYIQLCIERAVEDAKDTLKNHTYPFENIIYDFRPNNESYESFIGKLKEMGASEEQIKQVEEDKEQWIKDTQEDDIDE